MVSTALAISLILSGKGTFDMSRREMLISGRLNALIQRSVHQPAINENKTGLRVLSKSEIGLGIGVHRPVLSFSGCHENAILQHKGRYVFVGHLQLSGFK
jgi:hypothetical protein